MVIAAIAIAVWPSVTGWVAAHQAEQQVSEVSARHAAMAPDEAQAALELAREANRAMASGGEWAEQRARALGALDAGGTGVVAILEVPALGLRVPVYGDCSDEHLMAGAGLVEGTSLPVGGAGSNAVVAGHTGMPGAWMFDALDTLAPGDEVAVIAIGERLTYVVESSEIVLPYDASKLAPRAGADEVTLLTCRPAGVNTHRLLVHAVRAEDVADGGGDGDQDEGGEEKPVGTANVAIVCISGAMGCCALIVLLSWRNDDVERRAHGRVPGEKGD